MMPRLKDIRMKRKLLPLFPRVGFIPLALVNWWSARLTENALKNSPCSQLESVCSIKNAQFGTYYAFRGVSVTAAIAFFSFFKELRTFRGQKIVLEKGV